MSKIYSKTNYIEYKKNPKENDWLGKILSECFENFQDSDGVIRNSILDNILSYKLSLSPEESNYIACSDILSKNFNGLTYSWIAEKFGYSLISNPRKLTARGTLLAFELDIARGYLKSDKSYIGEYLSYAFELYRRKIIIDSVKWGCSNSKEISDAKERMSRRIKVFDRYYSVGPESAKLPKFSFPFLDGSNWDPDFFEFCYGDDSYGEWNYTWADYTGRKHHDWDIEDQHYFSCSIEATDQYLTNHINMLPTMTRPELLYFADLSIYCGCYAIWAFLGKDITGDIKDRELNKLYARLEALGKIEGAGMEVYKEMAELLKGHSASYYDLTEIQKIIGYKIYL